MSIVASTALGADPAAISTWFFAAIDSLTARIQAGYAANRNSSLAYLRRHARLNGASIDPVPGSLDVAALRKRLEIVGPIGFKAGIAAGQDTDTALRHMATQLGGVADEAVRNGDRDVITRTATRGRGVVGWRRRLSGRACGFCSMLASRGAVYVNRQSATVAKDGMAFHPHCHCWAEPLYTRQDEPADVRRLRAQWNRVTAGHSGKDAQRVWRQHWEQRATPLARERMGIPSQGPKPPIQLARVRQILADAQSPEAVSRVLEAEYLRVTGRTVAVDLRGSVATAREHAEGVLQAVERQPDIRLASIRTGQLQKKRAYAHADPDARELVFSEDWSSVAERSHYLDALAGDQHHGWAASGTGNPVGVAIHETGHILDTYSNGLDAEIEDLLARVQQQAGTTWERVVAHDVSGYATKNTRELIAEAWADVVTNGPNASLLSREIVRIVESRPGRGTGGVIGGTLGREGKRTATQLRAAVTEHGITVPTGLRAPDLERLVADLERGVPAATAREAAVRAILVEREGVAKALAQASEMAANGGSSRALQSLGRQLRRDLSSDQAKTARVLLEGLDAGDLARVRAALPVVARGAKLKPVGEAGGVLRLDSARMTRIGPGGADDVVRVIRPGFETTFERQTVTVLRADVLGATPEQAARLAPVKAAAPVRATYAGRQAAVRDVLSDARAVERPLTQGQQGRTVLVETPSGGRAVRKSFEVNATRRADAEELGARVADAVGLRAPATVRLADDTVGLEFLEGQVGREITRPGFVPPDILESHDGRLMGLLDIITGNADREPGNWIRLANGRLAAIDFNVAFRSEALEGAIGPFGRPLHDLLTERPRGGFTQAELAGVRRRLTALRPEFERLGRSDWHAAMMARLADVEDAVRTGRPLELGARPASAVKKATPAKKVAAPKAPPAPEKLSLPALKTEVQRAVDAAPAVNRVELAGVPKPTLVKWATRARELPPERLAEEVGRWRQTVIDARRKLAEALSEADELVANGASQATLATRAANRLRQVEASLADWPELAELRKVAAAMETGDAAKIRRAIKAAQKKVGLEQVGVDAGKVTRYNRASMSPISGSKIADDAQVVVVRPGYSVEIGGQRVVLSKPVVEVASPLEGLPKLAKPPTPTSAAKAMNPKFGTTHDGPTYRNAPWTDATQTSRLYDPSMGPLPSGAYEENCTNVVLAWDMRMRGYDVQAAPMHLLDRSGWGAGRTEREIDDLLDRAYRAPGGGPHGRSLRGQDWRSFDDIDAEIMREWPVGARGFIETNRHVFSVTRTSTGVEYIEAQLEETATRVVTARYKRKFKTDPWFSGPKAGIREEGKLIRLDDLTPIDGILETVQAAT